MIGDHVFASLAAGPEHTCGVTRAGEAYCWGLNMHGGLGNGRSGETASPTPTRVASSERFVSITVGWEFSCALTAERGEAYCWGANGAEQTGVPRSRVCVLLDGWVRHYCEPTPVRAAVGLSFASLAAGSSHVCGLTHTGDVYCWGENGQRQLANDRLPYSAAPVRIALPGRATAVRSGDAHSCAVVEPGALYCWGYNVHRQLGSDATDRSPPDVQRSAPAILARDVAGGLDHTCALDMAGDAWCWGSNRAGQLGRR